jgi:hypothetical protein
MAWQRWGERDPQFTEAFLRIHAGRPAFDPPTWRDAVATVCGVLAGIAKLALLIAAIRALV